MMMMMTAMKGSRLQRILKFPKISTKNVRRLSSVQVHPFHCDALHLKPPHFERPTPLLFLNGEGYQGESVWKPITEHFQQIGYSGAIVTIPYHSSPIESSKTSASDEIYAHCEDLYRACQCYCNPILIAHSFSTFTALKYLEGNPIAALCLINPVIPWNHMSFLDRLVQRYKASKGMEKRIDSQDILAYYGSSSPSSLLNIESAPFPLDFMTKLSLEPAAAINLEEKVVPTLYMATRGDVDPCHILTSNDLQTFEEMLSKGTIDYVYFPNDASRLPTLTCSDPMIAHMEAFFDSLSL